MRLRGGVILRLKAAEHDNLSMGTYAKNVFKKIYN